MNYHYLILKIKIKKLIDTHVQLFLCPAFILSVLGFTLRINVFLIKPGNTRLKEKWRRKLTAKLRRRALSLWNGLREKLINNEKCLIRSLFSYFSHSYIIRETTRNRIVTSSYRQWRISRIKFYPWYSTPAYGNRFREQSRETCWTNRRYGL